MTQLWHTWIHSHGSARDRRRGRPTPSHPQVRPRAGAQRRRFPQITASRGDHEVPDGHTCSPTSVFHSPLTRAFNRKEAFAKRRRMLVGHIIVPQGPPPTARRAPELLDRRTGSGSTSVRSGSLNAASATGDPSLRLATEKPVTERVSGVEQDDRAPDSLAAANRRFRASVQIAPGERRRDDRGRGDGQERIALRSGRGKRRHPPSLPPLPPSRSGSTLDPDWALSHEWT